MKATSLACVLTHFSAFVCTFKGLGMETELRGKVKMI